MYIWFVFLVGLVLAGVAPATADAANLRRHADPSLEALLPATLAGIVLTRESQNGVDLTRQSEAFDAFLMGLGKQRGDFTVASAYANGVAAEIGAWKIVGLNAAQLMPGFKIALQASSQSPLAVEETVVAGRPTTRIGDAQQLARGPLYVVQQTDTLLFVQTNNMKLVEEAIAKLPK